MTTDTLARPDWAVTGEPPSARIRTCLVVDADAEEAAAFWVSVVPDSVVEHVYTHPGGNTKIVEFRLMGMPYMAFNAPFGAEHTAAASISILTPDQAETDRLWAALGDGGTPWMCGWLRDRYGVHWQIIPEVLPRLLSAADTAAAGRALAAMMAMGKIDVAALEAAVRGEG